MLKPADALFVSAGSKIKMKDIAMVNRHLILPVALLSLAACQQLPDDVQRRVDTMNECEKVLALTQGTQNDFAQLKGSKVNSPLMSAWQPKAHLITDSCQINQYNSGNVAYECTKSFSIEADAATLFDDVAKQLSTCLGTSWQSTAAINNTLHYTSNASEAKITLSRGKGLDHETPWVVALKISR
ncbi:MULTISPECIES: hypothetical protein [Pseudoalteromonas]|uniref:Orphan lipoprotein n=1 Tax=Pseudoalteromonas rubra TaxID=43658 RepID=A0A5S3UQS9_9GAMM|nr:MULTISPECIES: hypothetical protein [Pseudoalteromonas]MCG7560036.1 hypothetical protein [Pseudoalteromonas sp. McH1-42]QPB86118.1 hypothetical protein CWC22_024295 [Pseudoalteromonas rubra]